MRTLASVDTPLGPIHALSNPDPTHPGIWIELSGEGDRQLVLVEYDADSTYVAKRPHFTIQVWAHDAASEAPAYVQHVPAEPADCTHCGSDTHEASDCLNGDECQGTCNVVEASKS